MSDNEQARVAIDIIDGDGRLPSVEVVFDAGFISYLTLPPESISQLKLPATPFHPQVNGKLERYYQTLKRDVNQLPYEMPSDLEVAIVAFVSYYTAAITRPWAT